MLFYCVLVLCLTLRTTTAKEAEKTLTIRDYTSSHSILLLHGKEQTIDCADPDYSTERSVVWYFGDVKTLRRIDFDADGRFVSPSGGGEFKLVHSNGDAISVRSSGHVGTKAKKYSLALLKPSTSTTATARPVVGPNGILACRRLMRRGSSPRVVIFHLMVVVPAAARPDGTRSCPIPGYRLGTYAGRAACHPCLPGEFAGLDSLDSCLPCGPGFESGFASPQCALLAETGRSVWTDPRFRQRLRRAAPDNASRLLKQKRLPLARFSIIVMQHFMLMLLLSVIVFLYLLTAAFSFDTVWSGVLSETETGIATVLEDLFVLDQPEPDNESVDGD